MRLDAAYPWLPVLLDWRAGELARYAAMLVPHQVFTIIRQTHSNYGSVSCTKLIIFCLVLALALALAHADEYENGYCV